MTTCIEVRLTIPDNEARTALATLRRLGVAVEGLERADLYRFDVDPGSEANLVKTLQGFETVYNPNKHALRVREEERPGPGEVWVDEIDGADVQSSNRTVRIGGLFGTAGAPAAPDVVTSATETLLCNPAFQKATRI
jgi:phosphoribosylformylglycinamidine (FGAM) synthase PurS component